jgi:hypothetical protein
MLTLIRKDLLILAIFNLVSCKIAALLFERREF